MQQRPKTEWLALGSQGGGDIIEPVSKVVAFLLLGRRARELPRWLGGKDSACQCRRCQRCGFHPWVGKIPWKRKWQSAPVFWPGKSCGQRSLEGYSPQGRRVRWGWETELLAGEVGPRKGQQLASKGQAWFLVVRLEGAVMGQAQVLGLLLSRLGHFHIQLAQGGFSHCFFQVLGQEVDLHRVLIWVGPQPNLHQHLVGEGVTHHEAGVAHGSALVDQLALGQPDDQCPFFNKSTWGLMFAFSTAFSFRHLISLSMLKHLIYTQWHHLSSVQSVDWWTMLVQPIAVTKCYPPDGSHPWWSPHTPPWQPKAHWWSPSSLWWIGPPNPIGPRHSPCPCYHSPLPHHLTCIHHVRSHWHWQQAPSGSHWPPFYTGCGPPLWSLQRCLRCQAAGTWCGCSWWGQHHCPASCSRAHPWSTVSAGCTTDTPHPCHSSGCGMPALAMAAVAWSWVEKILHLDHCTSPTQTDVCLTADSCLHGHVQTDSNMAPFSDLEVEDISCMCIRHGISFSMRPRALCPQAARLKSVAL